MKISQYLMANQTHIALRQAKLPTMYCIGYLKERIKQDLLNTLVHALLKNFPNYYLLDSLLLHDTIRQYMKV